MTCQNCHKEFSPLPGDAEFYKKIGVEPPTFCFHCRLQRRMSWRNERSLYKRKCQAPGHEEEMITMYSPEAPYVVYDPKSWWSDDWDALSSGINYDPQKTFFSQFSELLKKTPLPALSILNSVNSDYTNFVDGNKNCYLIFGAGWNENVSYGSRLAGNRDSQDLFNNTKSELSYECINCVECYRTLYSKDCKNCSDSYLLYNCRNCQNCFGCANLVNKSYCIFNEQYSKEEYKKKLEEFNLGSRSKIESLIERFFKEIYPQAIHRSSNNFNCVDVTGDNINNSKNCKMCFDIWTGSEDSNYLYGSLDSKDCYDSVGAFQSPLSCETVDCNVGSNNLSGITLYNCNNVAYSINCHSSSNLFGCVGLRNKQYCILNKQYSKEEYEVLVARIISEMSSNPYRDKNGRTYVYGDFFPVELSPYSYNETIAQEYFPLNEKDALTLGFPWRESKEKHSIPTVNPKDLIDDIKDANDDITKEIIGCDHEGNCKEQCTKAFRITPADLQFYRRLNIPLPTICPNCRHHQRLKKRNPMDLWKRKCQCMGNSNASNGYKNNSAHSHGEGRCEQEFETSYSPDGTEVVYCENCYKAEVE